MPIDLLTEIATQEWPQEGADVDSHVINREPGITSCSTFRIELADNGRYIRFEQPGPDHDQDQTQEEGLREWNGHTEMAHGDNHTTNEHGFLLPPDLVGNPSTR